MKYQNVCIEAVGYALPQEIVDSVALERRLAPLYDRLGLSEGRLELMTGIRQRRFWAPGTLPGDKSVETAEDLLTRLDFDRGTIGALIHGSVCRDYLEPATACGVHHRLGLPETCVVYDVSNACLGILNGMVQAANMIELGQISAALVVGTEDARPLVENTIEQLNADLSLTRSEIKPAIASLTVGSASAAVLMTDRRTSRTANRLLAATARAHTDGHELCRGGTAPTGGAPLMCTDSERLLEAGLACGRATFASFLSETSWGRGDIDRTVCHQVGSTHRRRMLEGLELDLAADFASFETCGNTGSVALPLTLALAVEQGFLLPKQHVALLGIGSGINSLMLAVDWQRSPLAVPTVQPGGAAVLAPAEAPRALQSRKPT